MKIDLKELEALARAATPGPWSTYDQTACNGEFSHVEIAGSDGTVIVSEDAGPGKHDSYFIAAANPAVVLELIALAGAPAASTVAADIPLRRFDFVDPMEGSATMDEQPDGWWVTYDEALTHTAAAVAAERERAASVEAQPVAWIDASVRKPQEGDLVLICGVIPPEVKTERNLKGWRTVGAFRDGDFIDGNGCTRNSTTHWMLLPDSAHDTAQPAQPVAAATSASESFQQRVQPWMMACFGEMIAGDREERNHRFLEEALELVQSTGCTAHEAHQLVDYVYGRDIGEPAQEVGGVMVTLAALCLANELDMHDAAEVELARIWTKVEAIRAKQAAKPKHSPLPQAAAGVPHIERDAARYQWLRHGDNDDKVIQRGPVDPNFVYLPRNFKLDEMIDAAMATQQGKKGGAA